MYEGDDAFEVLPTFGVIPQFEASSGVPLDWLPNFNPVSWGLLFVFVFGGEGGVGSWELGVGVDKERCTDWVFDFDFDSV